MTKPKTLDQLQAEKEQAETQLAQEQHKLASVITASRTSESDKYWYVIKDCTVNGK